MTHFFFIDFPQARSFEALTCCECSFSKRLRDISGRSRSAWILCREGCVGGQGWFGGFTIQKGASGEHVAVGPRFSSDFVERKKKKRDQSRLAGISHVEQPGGMPALINANKVSIKRSRIMTQMLQRWQHGYSRKNEGTCENRRRRRHNIIGKYFSLAQKLGHVFTWLPPSVSSRRHRSVNQRILDEIWRQMAVSP